MLAIPQCILVDPAAVQLQELTLDTDNGILLMMSTLPATAVCPTCLHEAKRVHSRYHRTLADLPWADVSVRIVLQVRRFFCDTPDCSRRIFTERLSTVARPWARRTTRLATLQQQVGLVAGGAGGAVLCHAFGCPISIDGLLTLVRRYPLPELPTPRVLGVDDWAVRKGQRYGTILVDQERECIVDLLPDRTPELVAQWLREHPGVEIVTRDRSERYAAGATQGAPTAIQVADRWHLLQNWSDVLERVLHRHHRLLRQIQVVTPVSPATTSPALLPPTSVNRRRPYAEQRRDAARRLREERWTTIRERYVKGVSLADIARALT